MNSITVIIKQIGTSLVRTASFKIGANPLEINTHSISIFIAGLFLFSLSNLSQSIEPKSLLWRLCFEIYLLLLFILLTLLTIQSLTPSTFSKPNCGRIMSTFGHNSGMHISIQINNVQ